jgi:hypothetical protein
MNLKETRSGLDQLSFQSWVFCKNCGEPLVSTRTMNFMSRRIIISWSSKILRRRNKSVDGMSCKRLVLKRLLLPERSSLSQFSLKPCWDSHPHATANFHSSAARHGSLNVQIACMIHCIHFRLPRTAWHSRWPRSFLYSASTVLPFLHSTSIKTLVHF